ncbi:GNAT family N-acetyltransferase [Arthrobacter sp. JSM 101049]|uniref:GNAT family N-acetyltransferase n=1 Tax=Arthrobacter sp. JSM 101049 TaxID=929097 RepID=UPI00356569C7
MPIVVENNSRLFQYQIFKAGELAGFVQYDMDGADMRILHTSMKRSFKSALLTDILIHHVLTEAHASRLAVLPYCPAVRTFITEHPEFTDLVPSSWQDRIPLPGHEMSGDGSKIPLDFVRLTGSRRARHLATTPQSRDVAQYLRTETAAIPVVMEHLQPLAGEPGDPAEAGGQGDVAAQEDAGDRADAGADVPEPAQS